MLNPAVGAALVSSAAGLFGARNQNKAAQAATAKQMQFQERMSNTAYQRATKDMRAAGINPMLAYMKGGASTPAGASYSPVNVGAAGAQNAGATASALQSIEQTNKIREEAQSVVQTRQIQEVVHSERWPRLFSTMSAENVMASAIATLTGVDMEQVLSQRDVNLIDKTSLRDFLAEVQRYSSTFARETTGISKTGQQFIDLAGEAAGRLLTKWMRDTAAEEWFKSRLGGDHGK
jgi:hypothetical protein